MVTQTRLNPRTRHLDVLQPALVNSNGGSIDMKLVDIRSVCRGL